MGTEPNQYLAIVMLLLLSQLRSLLLSGNSTIETNGTKRSDVTIAIAIAIAIAVWRPGINAPKEPNIMATFEIPGKEVR